MNILMVAACPFPANRGTPSRILRMSESLSSIGHQVQIVSYHIKDSSIAVNEDVNVHRIKPFFKYTKMEPGPSFKKPLLDILLAIKVIKVSKKYNIDVIHAHHIEGLASSILASRILNLPLIYDAHVYVTNELEILGVFSNKSFSRKIILWFEKLFINRASAIVTVSNELADILNSFGFPEHKTWVIPTGTNLEYFRNEIDSEIKNELKKSLGLSNREKIIIYTGTLTPYQGLEFLIDSMEILIKKTPSTRLIIVGAGDINKYRKLVEEKKLSDSIIFIGEKPFKEIPLFLSIADVAVSPRTESSGIPQKLTNYMAAGVPIVAYKGSAKILEHKKTGYIVENGDVKGFAEGMTELAENTHLSEYLAKNAAEKVENFTWPNLIKKCEECYITLVPKKRI